MAPQVPIYLVDFSVYKPPEELKVNYWDVAKAARKWRVRRPLVAAWGGPSWHIIDFRGPHEQQAHTSAVSQSVYICMAALRRSAAGCRAAQPEQHTTPRKGPPAVHDRSVTHPACTCFLQEVKDENYDFIKKVFERSGISPNGTYLPAWINPVHTKEPKYDMDTAKKEAEMTMCGAVADLLEKTGARGVQLGRVGWGIPSDSSNSCSRFRLLCSCMGY